ncbi:MAG: 2-amino-4-hydroxy-6-hydroxymethyldihydropteridine diphosphokinase [Rickettsiales bacterium]
MILLALGSNVGDRGRYFEAAHAALQRRGVNILRRSSVIETPALLPPDAPADWDQPFMNQVVQVETALPPLALLELLKHIEQELGRVDRGRWGPREIDLDLLCYDAFVLDSASLTLPHAQLHRRDFVLKPIMEIAPDWTHPQLGLTAQEMLATL